MTGIRWLKLIVAVGCVAVLLVAGGLLVRSGRAAAPPDAPDEPAVPVGADFGALAPAAIDDPVSIEKDKEGYTIWTYDYSQDAWCVPFSRLKYPFDLGGQDPSDLSSTELILTWAERPYVVDVDGRWLYKSAAWGVALNGDPGAWDGNEFTGEWNVVGSVSSTPDWPIPAPVQKVLPIDHMELIDGVNALWLQQQDFGNCSSLPDCACTCYLLTKLQLRGTVDLTVKEVWPENKARNVPVISSSATKPEIRVQFTTVISEATINKDTFQVYYLNNKKEPVYVGGQIRRLTSVDYGFVPDAPLMDGIRYHVSLWGETDALKANRDEWVQDLGGGGLEIGRHWVFWTLPELEVRVEPVQVLEGERLIAGKSTAVRVYLSSAKLHIEVWYKDWWDYVDVEDISISWAGPAGATTGLVSWRQSATGWHYAYGPTTARRFRLYDKYARLASRDTVNYYGFVPDMGGTYLISAAVSVRDSHNQLQRFTGQANSTAAVTRRLTVFSRAMAVGANYGMTGTINMSAAVVGHRNGMLALFPVPRVVQTQAAAAIPWYAPATTAVWNTSPGGDYERLEVLMELTTLCATTSGCDYMVGYAPAAWLVDVGLTSPRQAWYGILTQSAYSDEYRFVAAHEAGHLLGFDQHDTLLGGRGYDVRLRLDRRLSTAQMDPKHQQILCTINSFMNVAPVESPQPERIWIEWSKYWALRERLTTTSAALQQSVLADSLLVATGVITPSTGQVKLDPWYQLEPGEWVAPPAGPYRLVFLDGAGQEIIGYTRAFSSATTLQPAGGDGWDLPLDAPAPFALKVPYPAATARIQIRRNSDNALLAERTVSATAPAIAITEPANSTWTGAQPITWQTDAGQTRHFLVQVSTDNGVTWEAQAVHLAATSFTLETAALANSTQALVRVLATDGVRTAADVAGPFTIANPVGVDYVSPAAGEVGITVDRPLYAGFHVDMDPASLNSTTFTLSGGPYGAVPGSVSYDAESREATFIPATPLAYGTTYTAHVTTGVRTLQGTPIAAGATWSFTTEANTTPPRVRLLSPEHGEVDVARNAIIAVAWDRPMKASTLTVARFQMAEADGSAVTGSVAYDAAAQTATFTPGALLTPYTTYVVTLTAGIEDTLGNATFDPTVWAFTTDATTPTLALTNSYADEGIDSNGDGLYEQLSISVGTRVPAAGTYMLHGLLVDADGGQIAAATVTGTLTTGAHFMELAFDGAAIGGHGVDGPYTLTDVTLSSDTGATASAWDAYTTCAYPARRFPAPLRFGGLPDVVMVPETTLLDAFNVYEYAEHVSLPSSVLSYTVQVNTQPEVKVTLLASGVVQLSIPLYWRGSAVVTLQAGDGVYSVRDSFTVLAGWPQSVYLPLAMRGFREGPIAATSEAWITLFTDNFEDEIINWHRSGGTSHIGPLPPGVEFGIYLWDVSTCRVYGGAQSAWAYGGGDDGDLLPCGAAYPDEYSLGTMMNISMPFDFQYVAKGEYSAKVWTNLPPEDKLCLKVALLDATSFSCDYGGTTGYYGVCRSGVTNGWTDLKLDLSNVPTLGNVLGQPRVCVAITFNAEEGDSRAEGAYVDDASMRLCPQGQADRCPGALGTAPAMKPLTPGNIGGYPEGIAESALAVGRDGRVYALWTGKLNEAFNTYVFYSSSSDGVTWTPYEILSYEGGREPHVAVDNVHGRVHLAYANDVGIIHHTVTGGVVSAPAIVARRSTYYLPGLDLPSGGVAWPGLAVAETTGAAYLTWDEAYYVHDYYGGYALRRQTWHATWNGSWSEPLPKIHDRDTFYSTIAAAPDGQAMMAWLPRWNQSSGGGITPGDPIVARTAYGTEPGRFPLRQATHELYPVPERDETILLAAVPGANAFVLASYHTMWPGYTLTYRYLWKDGTWTGPLSVAQNASNVSTPVYVGGATTSPLIRYVYTDAWVLKTRTEINGVLGTPEAIADYLSTRGYVATPGSYFTDASGGLHLLVVGQKDGVDGFYYVHP